MNIDQTVPPWYDKIRVARDYLITMMIGDDNNCIHFKTDEF